MNYDLSVFCGHWPFRRLRRSSLAEQLAEFARLGIEGGCMSSLDAIFYNDPWEADEPLCRALAGSNWHPAICINPRLPWWELCAEKAYALGVRHLRLYPGIHRYGAESAESVFRLGAKLGMTLIVTARMEDDRLCWMLEQQPVRLEDYAALCRAYPQVPVLVSGFYAGELAELRDMPPNLWADTAGLCHGLRPVEELTEQGFPVHRLVFGSLSPLQSVQSHLLNLPKSVSDTILSQNPKLFLEGFP